MTQALCILVKETHSTATAAQQCCQGAAGLQQHTALFIFYLSMTQLSTSQAGLHKSPQNLTFLRHSPPQPQAGGCLGGQDILTTQCPSRSSLSFHHTGQDPSKSVPLGSTQKHPELQKLPGLGASRVVTLSQICPCPHVCLESQHMLPHGTQPLPQHILSPVGQLQITLWVHITPERQGSRLFGRRLCYFCLAKTLHCSAMLYWHLQGWGSSKTRLPATSSTYATQPGCCLFKTFIPKSE